MALRGIEMGVRQAISSIFQKYDITRISGPLWVLIHTVNMVPRVPTYPSSPYQFV